MTQVTQVGAAKDTAMIRIANLVDKFMQSNALYQEKLKLDDLMQIFSKLLDKVSPENIISLDEEGLAERIKGVMAIEATAGMLLDLTPEQIERFDAAVEGR